MKQIKNAEVLGIRFNNITMDEALAHAEMCIDKKKNVLIATLNAEMAMQAKRDAVLAVMLNEAELVFPDGAGVVWAARRDGYHVPERVAGYDFSQKLLAKAAVKGWKVYLLGSSGDVVAKAKAKAEELYKGINIVGARDGYFTAAEDEKIVAAIKDCQPDILLVALGVPKQEKWLYQHREALNVPLAIGVGGTFDVMAGTVKRAPLWMQKARLEWLFRLMRQPHRLFRMMDLPRFVMAVIKKEK